uniref:GLOBIN domain-containing protein n=1 Tax=Meloidogyne floridensis TaxID=298350 RepID=A0A915P8U8_9BILA
MKFFFPLGEIENRHEKLQMGNTTPGGIIEEHQRRFPRREESFGSKSPSSTSRITIKSGNNKQKINQNYRYSHQSQSSQRSHSLEYSAAHSPSSSRSSSSNTNTATNSSFINSINSLNDKNNCLRQNTEPMFAINGDLNPHQIGLIKRAWKNLLKSVGEDENEIAVKLLLRIFQLDSRNLAYFSLNEFCSNPFDEFEIRENNIFICHVKCFIQSLIDILTLKRENGNKNTSEDLIEAILILGEFCVEQMKIGYKIEYKLQFNPSSSSSPSQHRSIPFFSPFTPFLTQQSLPGPQFGRPSQPLSAPQQQSEYQQKHFRHHHSLPQINEEEKINETFPKPEEFFKKGILIENNKTNKKENIEIKKINKENEEKSKEEKLFKKWQWKNEENKEEERENEENNQKQLLNKIPPSPSSSFHQLKSSEENKNERKELGNKQKFNLKSNEIIQGRRMENERESQELSRNQQKLNFQNKQHKIKEYSTESNENIKYPNSESRERWTPKHTNNRPKFVAPPTSSSSSNSREENNQNKYSSNEQQNNRRGPSPPLPPPQPPKSPPLIFSNNQQTRENFHPTDFFPEHIRNGFPPFPEPFENNYRQNNE